MSNITSEVDPRKAYTQPPFNEPEQSPPGLEGEMRKKPDHGEETYDGAGRLKNRSVLITGGDSGIGRAVAIACAREGANVAISFLPEEQEDADETTRWIADAGKRSLELPGDVGNEAYCESLIEQTVKEFGQLDVLVNNAAFQASRGSIEDVTSEEWDRTFRTNIYPMFHLAKAAVRHMRPGSAIVNTASVQAYQPTGSLLAYATTKGAIVTFTKALSELLIEKGIRVNAVAPGPVWTPLIPSTMPQEKVKQFGSNSAMKRPAQPAELAPAYVFLACGESSYITGSVMDLTGGKMLP